MNVVLNAFDLYRFTLEVEHSHPLPHPLFIQKIFPTLNPHDLGVRGQPKTRAESVMIRCSQQQ